MSVKSDRLWSLMLPTCIGLLAVSFAADFTAPWTGLHDFNNAVWAQAAVNYSRAGLWAGAGMPSVFYFGELPIPPAFFYTHHPPMLAWLAYAITSVFGSHEWALRLLPISCSFLSLILLWRIVEQSAGTQPAALTCLVFVTLPMELTFGRMVNFEPLTLVLMLAAADRLMAWEATNRDRLPVAAMIWLVLAVQSSWVGHLLIIPPALAMLFHRDLKLRSIGRWVVAATVIGGGAFVVQSILANSDALTDLTRAFAERLSINDGLDITWIGWLGHVAPALLALLTPVWLLIASGGLVAFLLGRHAGASILYRGALTVLVITLIYLVVFRNASYVHKYAGFFLIVPVSVFAGLGLDSLANLRRSRFLGPVLVLLVAGYQAVWSQLETRNLRKPFILLDARTPQAEDLVVRLGETINRNFDIRTTVLTNMVPSYGPQLSHYAQRRIINCVTKTGDWRELQEKHAPVGGIIWEGGNGGSDLADALGRKSLTAIVIDGETFHIWQTAESMQ